MKQYTYNNTTFKVGDNAHDNWRIILSADKTYYWVHADNVPSAHVIIEIDEPIKDEIEYACELCKTHTKLKNNTSYVISQINNIKLGSKPGEVYFKDANKRRVIQYN